MRLLLSIFAVMLMAQSASAQALWRNFFTTNQNPIVEVVAGSNATVQASTVGVNLRRFTVSSVPSGLAQTNWPWQSITNINTIQIPYAAITNPPSVQTNWPLSSITNADYLTNWATIDTNTYVVKTGDTVSGPIYTTSPTTNMPAQTELVTAQWVRGLFNAGADYFNSTNIDNGATNPSSPNQVVYKFQSTIPISDARTYTTSDFLTNGGYIGAVIITNTFSQISGAALVDAYLGFTGGVAAPTLTLHPELYYSYDKTNWLGDFSGGDESITFGTTNLYQWAISVPTVTSTNASGFYVQRRFKVGTVTGAGVRSLTLLIGTNLISGPLAAGHLTMEAPNADAGNAFLANNQVFTGTNTFSTWIAGNGGGITNLPARSVGITIDGGGSAITTGVKGFVEVPYACTITAATMLADQNGGCGINVWRTNSTGFPPTAVGKISGAASPVLTSTNWSRDTTLTGWTTAIAANDILGFNVESNATITRVTLQLKVQQ